MELDLNEKVPVASHYVRSYASVLVDDSVPQVENVKVDTTSFTIDTSNLKSAFWGDEDSDSDEGRNVGVTIASSGSDPEEEEEKENGKSIHGQGWEHLLAHMGARNVAIRPGSKR